jgi:hypothetical protein
VVPASPRAVDQDLLGVGQVELFADDRLRRENDLEELGKVAVNVFRRGCGESVMWSYAGMVGKASVPRPIGDRW